jgi:hypothetical protein
LAVEAAATRTEAAARPMGCCGWGNCGKPW